MRVIKTSLDTPICGVRRKSRRKRECQLLLSSFLAPGPPKQRPSKPLTVKHIHALALVCSKALTVRNLCCSFTFEQSADQYESCRENLKFHIFDEAGARLDSGGTHLDKEVTCELAKACGFSEAGLVTLPHRESLAMRTVSPHGLRRETLARCSIFRAQMKAVNSCARMLTRRSMGTFRDCVLCELQIAAPLSTDARPAERVDCALCVVAVAWMGMGFGRPSDYHKVLLKRLKSLDGNCVSDAVHLNRARMWIRDQWWRDRSQ